MTRLQRINKLINLKQRYSLAERFGRRKEMTRLANEMGKIVNEQLRSENRRAA